MPPLGVQLESGAMLGPHRLLFRLGRGGMGEVWAAEQAGELGLSRRVAIKVIRSA